MEKILAMAKDSKISTAIAQFEPLPYFNKVAIQGLTKSEALCSSVFKFSVRKRFKPNKQKCKTSRY